MVKVTLKKNNMTVYVHAGLKPKMHYNSGKVVVSKQPNSKYVFCVDKDDIIEGYLL